MAKLVKRGNGDGSVTFVPKRNRFWARLVIYPTGKPRRVGRYFLTKQEAKEWLDSAKVASRQGFNVAPERQSVQHYLEHWLEDVVKGSCRLTSYLSYSEKIRLYIVPAVGRLPLQQLTAQHVQTMMNGLVKEGLSPRTAQYCRDILRNALNHAVRTELVRRNVATLATPPKQERYEYRILDPSQARVFLDAARNNRFEALFSVAVSVGLRLSEALGLRWQNVNLESGTLTVAEQLQRIKGKQVVGQPKTRRGLRIVQLPPFAIQALKDHRSRQLQDKLLAGPKWQEAGFVFANVYGGPADDSKIRKSLNAILERAGLPKMRFHDLRHTCASLLLAQNVNPRVVMEILGHSSISLTMNTYSHVLPILQQDAANLMESTLAATSA